MSLIYTKLKQPCDGMDNGTPFQNKHNLCLTTFWKTSLLGNPFTLLEDSHQMIPFYTLIQLAHSYGKFIRNISMGRVHFTLSQVPFIWPTPCEKSQWKTPHFTIYPNTEKKRKTKHLHKDRVGSYLPLLLQVGMSSNWEMGSFLEIGPTLK